MTPCNHAEALRDYAFDELGADARRALELHLTTCEECAAELDSMRLTTAALRILPDREIPQRIAFVSDKVFAPSPFKRFFALPWLTFASACVLSAGLIYSAAHRHALAPLPPLTAGISLADVDKAISAAVAKVRAEDQRAAAMTIAAAERRHEEEHRALILAVKDNLEVMQKRMGTLVTLASLDNPRTGAGQ